MSFLFPVRLACASLSQDRRGRPRTLPTHLPGSDDAPLLHMRSIPHAGDRERGGGGTLGFSVHGWPLLRHRVMTEKKDDDEDAAECLPNIGAEAFLEATTYEPQRSRQADVTHASSPQIPPSLFR